MLARRMLLRPKSIQVAGGSPGCGVGFTGPWASFSALVEKGKACRLRWINWPALLQLLSLWWHDERKLSVSNGLPPPDRLPAAGRWLWLKRKATAGCRRAATDWATSLEEKMPLSEKCCEEFEANKWTS